MAFLHAAIALLGRFFRWLFGFRESSVRTYLDSSVLIAAFKGEPDVGAKALAVIEDPTRSFVSSEVVRLEVLPGPIRLGIKEEQEFYDGFFKSYVKEWVAVDRTVADQAIQEAAGKMMQAVDSLHVACAHVAKVDELITAEGPDKPMCKTKLVKSVSLRAF